MEKKETRAHGKGPVRFAVVGAGWIAQTAVLPGFANAKNARLEAIVSGDADKRSALSERYRGVRTLGYEGYDALLASGDVDAVFLALPNRMHRDYAERAARAGVHVLCEKPMATTEADCVAMIQAADAHKVKLMVAYRLHFEAADLKAIELVQSGKLGEARLFDSVFTQQVAEGNIRLDADEGGSPLFDMGVYCINAARYLFRAEPSEVVAFGARGADPRFRDVPESVSALLRFPGGQLATFTCGFGQADVGAYRVVGTKGDLRVEPAYSFGKDLRHFVTLEGKTTEHKFPKHDQFGAEVAYFADCILHDREPEPSGLEGLADVRVVVALTHSMREGRAMPLGDFPRLRRPDASQTMHAPPVKPPRLVHAAEPGTPRR
jgi:predicted dehydrogenase